VKKLVTKKAEIKDEKNTKEKIKDNKIKMETKDDEKNGKLDKKKVDYYCSITEGGRDVRSSKA
jgi:hypothetical protein